MKVKILVVLLLFAVIFSVWYLVPKRYETTLEGVFYQLGNEKVFENVNIRLDGKLRHHLNGSRSFDGVVSFEGKGIPAVPKDQSELLIHYHGGNFASIFSGFKMSEGVATAQIYNYGMLYTNERFSQFSIAVLNGEPRTWDPSNGFVIAAPAQTKEEAGRLSRKLMGKFGVLIENE